MTRWDRFRERLAIGVHAIHGTRGLTLASAALLLFTAVEPGFPDALPRIAYALPLAVLLMIALATLPREGVAAQGRARALIDEPMAVRRMTRRALWGTALCAALLPNFFLAVQGVPHLSPMAGLFIPGIVRWVGLLGILLVLLLVVLYLRSSRGYAPEIVPLRPVELRETSRRHTEREVMMVQMWVLAIAWAWMLRGFWAPFSLLEWHGGDGAAYLASLHAGARSLAGIAFTVVPPVVLFIILSAHLALLREIHERRIWAEQRPVVLLAGVHIVLVVLAVLLHAYDLFWLIRYRSLGFL